MLIRLRNTLHKLLSTLYHLKRLRLYRLHRRFVDRRESFVGGYFVRDAFAVLALEFLVGERGVVFEADLSKGGGTS